jgi:eukaryotic-like serine/threonine-protein kinase
MSMALRKGEIFAGRYEILRRIASGGMGTVYEVLHLETERRRALKVMLPHIVQSAELRERFKREAKVAAHIDSEFIVDVFDAGVDEATQMPFLVMELLQGEELAKRVERLGRLPAEEVATFLQQASLALDKTHRASIVHRDLKPENLFLTRREDGSPRIKVLDFGIAKIVADGPTQASATRSLGTPLYMAPEQFQSGQKVTAACDIYALGMMAFTLLVGVPYWEEEASDGNVFAFARKAADGPQEPASKRARRHAVELGPAFDIWFAKITAMAPAERFSTASSAVAALAEALGIAPPAPVSLVSAPARVSSAPSAPVSSPFAPASSAPLRVSLPEGSARPSIQIVTGPGATGGAATLSQTQLQGPPPKSKSTRIAVGIVVAGLLAAGFVARARFAGHAVEPEVRAARDGVGQGTSAGPVAAPPVQPAVPAVPPAQFAAPPVAPATAAPLVPPPGTAADPAASAPGKPALFGKLPKAGAAGVRAPPSGSPSVTPGAVAPPPPTAAPAAVPPAPPPRPAEPTYSRD